MTGFIDPLDTAEHDLEPDPATLPESAGIDGETLERVRDLVLRAHPEVVPELVGGATLAALLGSIEPAHQAYADLAARLTPGGPAPAAIPAVPPVPAGGSGPAPLDLDRIPAAEKLRRGLRDRIAQSLRQAS